MFSKRFDARIKENSNLYRGSKILNVLYKPNSELTQLRLNIEKLREINDIIKDLTFPD